MQRSGKTAHTPATLITEALKAEDMGGRMIECAPYLESPTATMYFMEHFPDLLRQYTDSSSTVDPFLTYAAMGSLSSICHGSKPSLAMWQSMCKVLAKSGLKKEEAGKILSAAKAMSLGDYAAIDPALMGELAHAMQEAVLISRAADLLEGVAPEIEKEMIALQEAIASSKHYAALMEAMPMISMATNTISFGLNAYSAKQASKKATKVGKEKHEYLLQLNREIQRVSLKSREFNNFLGFKEGGGFLDIYGKYLETDTGVLKKKDAVKFVKEELEQPKARAEFIERFNSSLKDSSAFKTVQKDNPLINMAFLIGTMSAKMSDDDLSSKEAEEIVAQEKILRETYEELLNNFRDHVRASDMPDKEAYISSIQNVLAHCITSSFYIRRYRKLEKNKKMEMGKTLLSVASITALSVSTAGMALVPMAIASAVVSTTSGGLTAKGFIDSRKLKKEVGGSDELHGVSHSHIAVKKENAELYKQLVKFCSGQLKALSTNLDSAESLLTRDERLIFKPEYEHLMKKFKGFKSGKDFSNEAIAELMLLNDEIMSLYGKISTYADLHLRVPASVALKVLDKLVASREISHIYASGEISGLKIPATDYNAKKDKGDAGKALDELSHYFRAIGDFRQLEYFMNMTKKKGSKLNDLYTIVERDDKALKAFNSMHKTVTNNLLGGYKYKFSKVTFKLRDIVPGLGAAKLVKCIKSSEVSLRMFCDKLIAFDSIEKLDQFWEKDAREDQYFSKLFKRDFGPVYETVEAIYKQRRLTLAEYLVHEQLDAVTKITSTKHSTQSEKFEFYQNQFDNINALDKLWRSGKCLAFSQLPKHSQTKYLDEVRKQRLDVGHYQQMYRITNAATSRKSGDQLSAIQDVIHGVASCRKMWKGSVIFSEMHRYKRRFFLTQLDELAINYLLEQVMTIAELQKVFDGWRTDNPLISNMNAVRQDFYKEVLAERIILLDVKHVLDDDSVDLAKKIANLQEKYVKWQSSKDKYFLAMNTDKQAYYLARIEKSIKKLEATLVESSAKPPLVRDTSLIPMHATPTLEPHDSGLSWQVSDLEYADDIPRGVSVTEMSSDNYMTAIEFRRKNSLYSFPHLKAIDPELEKTKLEEQSQKKKDKSRLKGFFRAPSLPKRPKKKAKEAFSKDVNDQLATIQDYLYCINSLEGLQAFQEYLVEEGPTKYPKLFQSPDAEKSKYSFSRRWFEGQKELGVMIEATKKRILDFDSELRSGEKPGATGDDDFVGSYSTQLSHVEDSLTVQLSQAKTKSDYISLSRELYSPVKQQLPKGVRDKYVELIKHKLYMLERAPPAPTKPHGPGVTGL